MTVPQAPKPELLRRERGGWLAVSAPGEALHIGVAADDEPSALRAFHDACARWLELCQTADERDRNPA